MLFKKRKKKSTEQLEREAALIDARAGAIEKHRAAKSRQFRAVHPIATGFAKGVAGYAQAAAKQEASRTTRRIAPRSTTKVVYKTAPKKRRKRRAKTRVVYKTRTVVKQQPQQREERSFRMPPIF